MAGKDIQHHTGASAETEIRTSAPQSTQDYGGYQPIAFADLVSKEIPTDDTIEACQDPTVIEDGDPFEFNFGFNRIAKVCLALVSLLLCFCLLVFIPPVACGVQLCHKYDNASSTDSGFMVFKFIFPYQFVWGAFTTGVGGILAALIHLFLLSDNQIGSRSATQTALDVQKVSKIFLQYELFAELIFTFPLFILIGFGVSWSTAGCFLLGVVLTTLTGWFCIYIANYGSIRVAAEAESQLSFQDGMNAIFRAAASMALLSMSFAVGGVALAYLSFRNIRGLLGFAAGVSTIALTSRVSSGIYAASTDAAKKLVGQLELNTPDDDPRNPVTIAARVTDNLEGAIGVGVEFFESLVSAIVATAILATCMPYVQQNSYALCVYNHLHIDHACIAYDVATVKVSFAAQICRANNYYEGFPDLFFMESNSIFIAVPFVVATLGVLTVLACTIRMFVLNLEIASDRRKNLLKVLLGSRTQVAVASLLFFLGTVAIAFGFFGAQSNFQRRLSKNNFPRRELKSLNDTNRCVPTQDLNGNAGGENLPVLTTSLGPYRATSVLGSPYPKISEVPWRVTVCLALGQLLGLLLQGLAGFFTGSQYPLTKGVARMAECSVEDVIIHGLGTALSSTAIPLMLILSTVLGSFSLFGNYGIGLSAVSMISSSGMVYVIGAFKTLATSAGSAVRINKRPQETQNTIEDLGAVGCMFATSFCGLSAGASILTTFALIAELIRMTNLIPSPIEVIGVPVADPLRHISSADSLGATSPNVVVSVFAGVVLPFVFVALPLLGMSRTRYAILVETRKQFRECSDLRIGTEGTMPRTQKCVRISTKYALFEMILPIFVLLVVPQIVGFGLGQRALVGLLLASVGCGYLLGTFLLNASTSWQNAKMLVGNEHFGADTGKGSQWYEYVSNADAVGLFLKRTCGPSLSIAIKLMAVSSIFVVPFMEADARKWIVGLGILSIAAFMTISVLLVSHMYQRRTQKIARSVVVDRLVEPDESSKTGDFEKVQDLPVSPFYEEGISVARHRIVPTSALGRARIHSNSISSAPINSLNNGRNLESFDREYLASKREN